MFNFRSVAGGALAAAAVFSLIASGSANEATKVSDGGSSASSASSEGSSAKVFKVGDTVKLGDWTLKVNKVTDPLKPSNDMITREAGKRWVRVNATVTNGSKEVQTVSSLICFEVRDSESQKYTLALTGDSASQLDGEVASGESLKGNVDFEVDAKAKGLVLYFKCDFLSSGSARVALS